jgi:hypothetical protein
MSTPADQLLRRLLPRYFWLRDAEDGGGVLAALVDSLAAQYDQLRIDVDELYNQFFIATCDPDQVPLLGDEIGVPGLAPVAGPGIGDRALVGRMLQLRRRKGSLATAARGVIAATGWATYIQEGRGVVSATASVRAPDLQPPGYVSISGRTPAAELGRPWSPGGRTASVSGRPLFAGETDIARAGPAGFPAPATVSLHVWRLMSFPVTDRTASPARDVPARLSGRAFRFDPLGRDIQLFVVPSPPADRELPPGVGELPLALSDDMLPDPPAGQPAPVTVQGHARLIAGDLRDWHHPPQLERADAIVDPRRGRLLLAREAGAGVTVSYAYGFPGEIGGGPYGTSDDYAPLPAGALVIQVAQTGAGSVPTIEAALREAEATPNDAVGRPAQDPRNASITIEDSGTYTAPGGHWTITVPDGLALRISSAPEAAPVLAGEVRARVGRQSRLELSGVTIAGTLTVEGDGELAIEQCTLSPEPGRDSVRSAAGVAVALSFAILGGVSAGDLTVTSSIVDGDVTCTGSLDLEQVTVLGDVRGKTVQAGDSIFTGALTGERGLVRTSYLAEGSRVLQQLSCTGPRAGEVRFASTRWGDADYCQLSLRCPRSIAVGGSLGSEMGAFNWLGQPERFARVPVILQEFLPAGIGASVSYVN